VPEYFSVDSNQAEINLEEIPGKCIEEYRFGILEKKVSAG
jgi:hypothetical protein